MKIVHKDLNMLAEALANSEYDFYASAVTPWHLINIEAYLLKIGRNKTMKGIMSLGKHVRSGYVLKPEDVIPVNNIEFDVCIQDKALVQIMQKKQRNKMNQPLYIIAPLDYQYELGRCVRNYGRKNVYLIRTDEGILEYYGNDYRKMTRKRDGLAKRPLPKAVMDWLILKVSMRNWDEVHTVDRYMMKKNKAGDYVPQQDVVDSVRRYLQITTNSIPHKQESYALFLSFVWEEDNMWNMEEYKTILKGLQSLLCCNGIKLYVKPHPREKLLTKYSEWDVPLFTTDKVALETLLANLEVKPIAMFGLDSTALINASMLGACVPISLNKLVTKEYVSDVMWTGLEMFEKYFKGYVKFVDNMKSICDILNLSNNIIDDK